MPRFKKRDLLVVLAAGLLLWLSQQPGHWQRWIPRPGTQISLPKFEVPNPEGWTPHHVEVEVDVGWLTELGERVVWSGMRFSEQVSQGAVSVAHALRRPWDRLAQPAEPPRYARTVVVDPGHGGRDPGATGIGGLSEKWVTLRLSRALRSELEARGFRVITTRYGDQTVSLRRRIEIAEQEGGDLFVSLHVNATAERDVHGIMTYYPDKSYERHVLRVADGAGGARALQRAPGGRPDAVSALSETFDRSAGLADAVHQRAVSGVREKYRTLSDRGVRSGPFYVLYQASMPSVLMEVGFLTHPEEATRMRGDAYVSLLAEAIADGIAGYRDNGDWDRTVAVRQSPAVEDLRNRVANTLAGDPRAVSWRARSR